MVVGKAVQGFSKAGTVALTMSRATELPIPQEPKWTDLFAAIQTSQAELSKLEMAPP